MAFSKQNFCMVLLIGGQALRSFSMKLRPGDGEGHWDGVAPRRDVRLPPPGPGEPGR